MPPIPPNPRGSSPAAGTDSRRTGAAWIGLCGVGQGMDFGVDALILMDVIMIGPPKSEKLKAPHRGDATAGGDVQAGTAVVPGRGDDQHVPIPGVPDRPGQEILRFAGRDPPPAADVDDVRPCLYRLFNRPRQV